MSRREKKRSNAVSGSGEKKPRGLTSVIIPEGPERKRQRPPTSAETGKNHRQKLN